MVNSALGILIYDHFDISLSLFIFVVRDKSWFNKDKIKKIEYIVTSF